AGTLPTGLTLSNAGVLSGTPTAVGTFNFTITGTDSSTGTGPYSGTQAYTVTISLALSPTTLPGGTVGTTFTTSTITASGGTGTVTYKVTTGALPTGLSLSTGGVLSGTPTAGGSFNFTITATDSAFPTHNTGSQAYSVTVGAPSINVTPDTLPGGIKSTAYSQTLSASGGTSPYAFTKSTGTLPTGLTLTNGVISGTPTTVGTFTFTITGTDSSTGTGPYAGTQAYTVTISLALSPATLPAGKKNTTYTSTTITASGGTGTVTYKVTTGALPTGLSLSTGGVLSGTPSSKGTFDFTITATDSATPTHNTGSQDYAVTIS
ncbi:MAG TPA: putative Ig domain-containing protein, partial [Acidimicrobiales bacterium]|nr:putative Ig domain-containing protein [Acidimicrobiales bacterium]